MPSIVEEQYRSAAKEIFRFIEAKNSDDLRRVILRNPEQKDLQTHANAGTWLHSVASDGWLQGVTVLLDAGMSVTSGDRDGCVPLCNAARKGYTDLVQLFLDHGSPIEQADQVRDPLFAAVVERSVEVAGLLMRAGADPLVRHQGRERTLNAIGFGYYMGADGVAEAMARHATADDETRFEKLTEAAKRDGGRYEDEN